MVFLPRVVATCYHEPRGGATPFLAPPPTSSSVVIDPHRGFFRSAAVEWSVKRPVGPAAVRVREEAVVEILLIALVWLLNFGLSAWNAYAVGKSWVEAGVAGGWP